MTAVGRPLRALGALGLGGAVWLTARVPEMAAQYDATLAEMAAADVPSMQALVPTAPASRDVARHAPVSNQAQSLRRLGPQAPDPIRQKLLHSTEVVEAPKIKSGPGPAAPAAGDSVSAKELVALSAPGFDLATQAYAALQVGDRRAASKLFTAALAAAPDAPQAAQWSAEKRGLNRRWSGDAYVLFRDAGTGGAAASPVLGGGQSGASAAWAVDPLARRPLAVIGRVYAAHDASGLIDGDTAQAAVGVRWQPVRGISIAAERLIAIGARTSGDWNLRVAAGGERRVGPALVDGYAEAGVRGNGDVYAGGQARAAVAVATLGPVAVSAGPGAWGSVQTGFATVTRLDVGAGVAAAIPGGLVARADWRWRVAGNAEPGSGPAVTVAWSF